MDITHPAVDAYLHALTPDRDPVLQEMERIAAQQRFPIVGPLVGRLLYQLTIISGARRVLEFGSGFGYSAYWFAKALPSGGVVVCTEGSGERVEMMRASFRRGGMERKLEAHVGDALEVIDRLDGPFDVIFNDIDKERYPEALRKALPLLRDGGLFVSDNVLWGGSVTTNERRPDALAIQEFNRTLYGTPGLWTTILPLRDGVSVSVKGGVGK